ncbi:MAG: GH3 auxin-responsive promoter family protein [Phycisphaerales bacterium]
MSAMVTEAAGRGDRANDISWRWTSLVGAGLRARVAGRIGLLSDVEYWRTNTARLQVRQLRTILRTAAGTEIGFQNRFHRLARVGDADLVRAYRDVLQAADWYAFRDRLSRMREHGEPGVLWPGLVRDFCQTSGTTAGDKFIPLSREMMRSNFRASLDIFANLARFGVDLTRLLVGKCLFLGGSSSVSTNRYGVRTGDLSGLVVPMIRWPLSEIYLPGPDIALESHWPTKIEKMARRCLEQDVRMVSGMPSWALVLFQRVLELARERRGASRGVPAPECLLDVWPNLSVFVHGGVRYEPFRPRLGALVTGDAGGDFATRHELYPASEGFIAMQDTPGDPGLRLCSDIGNFYEFIPLEEIDKPNPAAFTCDAVEKGQRYVVCMTTCAGLYRYIIGDVVVFDTIPGGLDGRGGDGACRLRIVGRHRLFINAFGENLIVEHIERAVEDAARAAGVEVGEFTAAPVYPEPGAGRRGGLEVVVESEGLGDAGRRAAFAAGLDESLKRQNVDYTTKRTDSLGMGAPTVTPVGMGAFHRWLESRGKLGGQHKVPRCANHREIVEAIAAR